MIIMKKRIYFVLVYSILLLSTKTVLAQQQEALMTPERLLMQISTRVRNSYGTVEVYNNSAQVDIDKWASSLPKNISSNLGEISPLWETFGAFLRAGALERGAATNLHGAYTSFVDKFNAWVGFYCKWEEVHDNWIRRAEGNAWSNYNQGYRDQARRAGEDFRRSYGDLKDAFGQFSTALEMLLRDGILDSEAFIEQSRVWSPRKLENREWALKETVRFLNVVLEEIQNAKSQGRSFGAQGLLTVSGSLVSALSQLQNIGDVSSEFRRFLMDLETLIGEQDRVVIWQAELGKKIKDKAEKKASLSLKREVNAARERSLLKRWTTKTIPEALISCLEQDIRTLEQEIFNLEREISVKTGTVEDLLGHVSDLKRGLVATIRALPGGKAPMGAVAVMESLQGAAREGREAFEAGLESEASDLTRALRDFTESREQGIIQPKALKSFLVGRYGEDGGVDEARTQALLDEFSERLTRVGEPGFDVELGEFSLRFLRECLKRP